MQNIKTFDFISKLGDAYFALYNTLCIIKQDKVKDHLVDTMTQGVDEMLLKYITNMDGTKVDNGWKNSDTFKTLKQLFIDRSASEIENYELIFLNQNLVMQCTIMEIFFLHILEVVFEKEPRVMLKLSKDKNITLEQVVELKTYNLIMDKFKCKIYDEFSKEGIKYKFDVYEKIGLDISEMFTFPLFIQEVQKEFKGYDLDKLIEVFQKRHDIVHKNVASLTSINELIKIKRYFEIIILSLSKITSVKYNIILDLQDTLIKVTQANKNTSKNNNPKYGIAPDVLCNPRKNNQ